MQVSRAATDWINAPFFADQGPAAIGATLSPAFRVTGFFPYRAAHPYTLTDAWEAVFACFKPIVEERCDRIRMWEMPGAKARRSKAVQTADWHPFRHLKAVHSNVDSGIFTGFSFADSTDDKDMSGRGPTAFRFFVGSSIRLDATVSVADWNAGRLDIDAVCAALSALPFVSFTAGLGFCLSERHAQGDDGGFLGRMMPAAHRYPVLDTMHAERRAFFSGDERDFPKIGLAGINWITGVGEPFFSKGGGAKLGQGLPDGVTAETGKHGIVFRLGDAPITGEAGVDDATLPLYHALGQRLKTVWSPQPRPSPVFGDDYPRESLAWERRFFDGPGK